MGEKAGKDGENVLGPRMMITVTDSHGTCALLHGRAACAGPQPAAWPDVSPAEGSCSNLVTVCKLEVQLQLEVGKLCNSGWPGTRRRLSRRRIRV